MLADLKHGGTNNNSQEGHQKQFKIGTQGLSGNKMHSGPYVLAVFTFITEYSEESYSEMVKTQQGLGSLKCILIPSKLHYNLIQGMHPKTLISIYCLAKPAASHLHLVIQHVTELGDINMRIHVKLQKGFAAGIKMLGSKPLCFLPDVLSLFLLRNV